jgi:hypothetical protein
MIKITRSMGRRQGRVPPAIRNPQSNDSKAAFISSLNYKKFIVYHTNKIRGREREKGIGTKMRVKLAAKLLIIAWTLMKKREPFDPGHLNRSDKAA